MTPVPAFSGVKNLAACIVGKIVQEVDLFRTGDWDPKKSSSLTILFSDGSILDIIPQNDQVSWVYIPPEEVKAQEECARNLGETDA